MTFKECMAHMRAEQILKIDENQPAETSERAPLGTVAAHEENNRLQSQANGTTEGEISLRNIGDLQSDSGFSLKNIEDAAGNSHFSLKSPCISLCTSKSSQEEKNFSKGAGSTTENNFSNKEEPGILREIQGDIRVSQGDSAKNADSHRETRLVPHFTADGSLRIPFDCDPKYHWWKGGQSVEQTRQEVIARMKAANIEDADKNPF